MDISPLKNYYEQGKEDNRLRSRHGSVEYLTTMNYIQKYLKTGDRIIEIGAGTGIYSHALARMGYSVDAVELFECNIEKFKQNTFEGESVTIKQGNAIDLCEFCDNTYDITLLLGPMYHLYTEEEQLKALSEAIRVTKKDGIIFAAYCNNDATIVTFGFQRDGIRHPHFKDLIDPVTFKATSTPAELFQLYRKENIDALMSHFNTTRLHYIGTDMATNFMKSTVDEMDDELFELYLRYHFYICEREDMVGATHHILDIFKKDRTL